MIDSSDFTLRAMRSDDIDIVRKWRNLEQVKTYMFTDSDINEEEHKTWFGMTLLSDDSDYQIVEYQNKPVGLANAIKINKLASNCFWGFYLGDPNCPKGCGTMLALLMLEHIFNTHPIQTIYGEVFEFNTASLKLHNKFGFKTMLELAKTVAKNGNDENVITLSLSQDDWETTKLNIRKTQNP